MVDVGSIQSIAGKKGVTPVRSELKVSMEKTEGAPQTAQTTFKQAEIEMQNAERAFALMMEIRQKIEASYRALNPEEK